MLYVLKNDEKYYYLPEDILNEVIDKRLRDINVMQFKATKEHFEAKQAYLFNHDWKKAFITLEKQHLFGIGFNPYTQTYTVENIHTYLELYKKRTKWQWFRWKHREGRVLTDRERKAESRKEARRKREMKELIETTGYWVFALCICIVYGLYMASR